MFAKSNSQDQRILQAIKEQFSSVEGVIFPGISRSTAFADASEQHLPLALYAPKHPANEILNSIAQILEGLK